MKNISLFLFIGIRRFIYLLLGGIDDILGRKNIISIFSYHSVAADDWKFSIDKNKIIKQIKYLKKNYDLISLIDIEAVIKGDKQITKPAVVLTFDDGYKDILTLKQFFISENIKPVLFVLSDTKFANHKELDTYRSFLTNKEIIMLHRLGWSIGCHSATHANLSTLSKLQLKKEIIDSKQALEMVIKQPIFYFSYPKGKYTAKVIEIVKAAGYALAVTVDDGIITTNTNMYQVPRIGIDRSHNFAEFKMLSSPSVILFRQLCKRVIRGYL